MYGDDFYAVIRDGIKSSASVLVPLLLEVLGDPHRIADIGCGEGWWAHEFAEYGCRVVGVDGGYVQFVEAFEDLRFVSHDLREPLPTLGDQDMVVSLEVAEHLPEDRADGFIRELCSLAPRVVFSAAIPGQGGTGHLNEQWPAYWAKKFEANRFAVSGALRWDIWDDPRVENWYRQNLLIAVPWSDVGRYPHLFDTTLATPYPVVHPVLYDARRAQ